MGDKTIMFKIAQEKTKIVRINQANDNPNFHGDVSLQKVEPYTLLCTVEM